jgi:glycosyltransferase involved in cell wall biosynthesis
LAYNSGQTAGTLAGIRNSTGDAVITMDADLQHHPQDIPKVLELLNKGHAVVSSWRYDRADEPAGKRIPSRISNSLARLMTGVPAHDFGSGFKGYYAPRLSELILYGSFHRYIPALILQPQDTLGEVRIDYRDRIGGKTKYGATRILKGVRDLIYITMITRFKGNIFANLWASFMVYLHYDQGRDTYRIASKIGFE